MAEDVKTWLHEFKKGISKVREQSPEAINGFANMYAKIMQDGALPLKTKELIAVAVGTAVQCDPCIRLHAQKCLDLGCTRQEILEAASVAVMMGGGPAYTHLPVVAETLDALQG